jgi:hypothetical protein
MIVLPHHSVPRLRALLAPRRYPPIKDAVLAVLQDDAWMTAEEVMAALGRAFPEAVFKEQSVRACGLNRYHWLIEKDRRGRTALYRRRAITPVGDMTNAD